MKNKSQQENATIHITGSAKNSNIEYCEFIGIDLINDGENTRIAHSKFSSIFSAFKNAWHSTWWGKFVLTVLAGIVIGAFLYFFGWNK